MVPTFSSTLGPAVTHHSRLERGGTVFNPPEGSQPINFLALLSVACLLLCGIASAAPSITLSTERRFAPTSASRRRSRSQPRRARHAEVYSDSCRNQASTHGSGQRFASKPRDQKQQRQSDGSDAVRPERTADLIQPEAPLGFDNSRLSRNSGSSQMSRRTSIGFGRHQDWSFRILTCVR